MERKEARESFFSKAIFATVVVLLSFSLFLNLLIIAQALLEPVKVIRKTDGNGLVGEMDAVIARTGEDDRIGVGDLVVFREKNYEGEYAAYRVVGFQVDERGVDCALVSSGANPKPIPISNAIGKAWIVIPGGGLLLDFVRTPRGYLLCVVSPWLLLILYLAGHSLLAKRIQGAKP